MSSTDHRKQGPDTSRGLTLAWAVLMALSLANFFLADSALVGATLVAAILLAVLVKFGLVLAVLMELGHRGTAWLFPAMTCLGLLVLGLGLMLA